MADMRRRSNEHNVTWQYAGQCWRTLSEGRALPPVPNYQIYESSDGVMKGEKLIGEKPITPCKITYNDGTVYFG